MIFEKIDELCKKNNTTVTALCIEVTGSSGNLPTWKKDHIKPIWLISICKKFKVSSDYLLGLDIISDTKEQLLINDFRTLSLEDQDELLQILEIKVHKTQRLKEKNREK